MKKYISLFFVNLILTLFDTQVTTLNTTGNDLSPEMKTHYSDYMIDNAEPKLVHDQLAQRVPIPTNGGKTIEFRKYSPLAKALNKLSEGVTPAGNKLNVSVITATVDQYGDYIVLSDMLEFTAIDRNIEQATKLLGSQGGRTLDTVTREVVTAGTNKLFAPSVTSGVETPILLRSSVTDKCLITPDIIGYGVACLEGMNAEPDGESFFGIIHPHAALDIMQNEQFIDIHQYAHPENLYTNEIGEISNVRFVKSTEAKVIGPGAMLGIDGYCRTTVKTAVSTSADVYPSDPFTVAQASAINAAIGAGTVYTLYVDSTLRTVASVVGGAAGTCKITLTGAISADAGKMICGIGAGADGSAIYCTMIIGQNAYGVTEISGMGLQHIVKQLGSSGSSDPLNQRSSVGWKATKVAERLVEEYMIRIEHTTKRFSKTAVSN